MTADPDTALRRLAGAVISQYAGAEPDADAIAAAARRAYDELAGAAALVIGVVGLDALTGRAIHLAGREHPWLTNAREPGLTEERFDAVVTRVRQRDPATGADGATAVLERLGGLLMAFIGDALTWRLLRQAWPDGSFDPHRQEADS